MEKLKKKNTHKIIVFKNLNFITITGKECEKFLNGQFTGNILKIKKKEHILTSHCTKNGKILAIIRLFHYKKGFGYIIKKKITKNQTKELKKYSIFSKIKIKKEEKIKIIGIIGKEPCKKIEKYFKYEKKKENLIFEKKQCILIYFPNPIKRFLIIINKKELTKLKKNLKYKYISNDKNWKIIDVISGIPNIELKNTNKITPNSINLENIRKAIDFKKGCYLGQEIITKIKNKQQKKEKMHILIGISNKTPKIGEKIEYKEKNKKYYQIGNILEVIRLNKKQIIIQIILKENKEKIKHFNVIGEKNSLLNYYKKKKINLYKDVMLGIK